MTRPAPYCADQCVDEPLAGTAPHVTTWLIVETDSPWSARPLQDGPLGPVVGPSLESRTTGTTTRVQLARSPDRDAASRRRVWLAAHGLVASTEVYDVRALLDLDLSTMTADTVKAFGQLVDEPLLFVCQNGRRDACCSRLGRPLAAELAGRFPGQVWETTHLNGHRFAPTALLLPDSTLHGRLDADAAGALLRRGIGDPVEWANCRGRSTLTQPAQAAELAVRDVLGSSRVDDLQVSAAASNSETSRVQTPALGSVRTSWRVTHLDGREWLVDVAIRDLPPAAESCNKPPVPRTSPTPTIR